VAQIHVLIIDDNIDNINIIAAMLASENHTYTSITNPRYLNALLESVDHFDVVFLDLEMPGLNGYDVLKMLKNDPRFEGIPVVACTVNLHEMQHTHKMGFDSFIGKPLNIDKFPSQIQRIVNGEQVWETS
jgi:two-component system, cell cycle response regulator DivK